MDEFLSVIPKFLGSDILEKEESKGRGAAAARHADNEKSLAKMEFKTALFRYRVSQIHCLVYELMRVVGATRARIMGHLLNNQGYLRIFNVSREKVGAIQEWHKKGRKKHFFGETLFFDSLTTN